MEFTKSQNLAIELRNRNILVSAAAGSGKTATLTERIIRLLTDKSNPADINSMLIVTFTRAAAGELRTRISKALSNALALDPTNKHIANQLTSLGSAAICTIDAYYLDLVRSNFQRLDLPARFRLADETELALIREEVMNAVIERRYETDEEFIAYADQLTTAKGESKLAEPLLDLANKILMIPQGTDYLAECAARYFEERSREFFDTSCGQLLLKSIKEEVGYLLRRSDRLIKLIDLHEEAAPYGKAVSADRDYLFTLNEMLGNATYDEIRAYLFDYTAVGLGRISSAAKSEFTEDIKEERNKIKDRIVEFREREFSAVTEDIPQMAAISGRFCSKTKEILDDYFLAYCNEKSSRNICEFSDLRKYALNLLLDENGSPTLIAIEEQKKYSQIFVDEYQDTDAIQDLVFRTISNGSNLFFVGDIKQSIYSFRGAEPTVFSTYRKSYLPAEGRSDIPSIPLSVFMSENFRCSPNIISFTNAVCSYLFRETDGDGHGIGYVSEDDLIASRSAPVSDEKVRIVLLEYREDNEDSDVESEYVITEIKKLLNERKRVDGDPLKPSDIAILTRSNKEAMKIADSLAAAGIPHANSTGNDLFENQEVLLMLCLLTASDNPQRDIPLAGALRSPLFGFTMSDLVNIRSGKSSMSLYDALHEYSEESERDVTIQTKCRSAIEKLDKYRREAEAMPVHLFMRYIWKDTNALSFAGSDEKSKNRTPIERRRNLRKFYEYARKFEASSFKGLHEFVEYINGIISRGTKITDEDAVTENTVRIMTVHKSKGLEFPVVFLVGCDKRLNDQDSRKSIVFTTSDNIGLTCKVPDSTGLAQLDTPYRQIAAKRVSEISSEEEIRILYVALTRARDVLYVVASGKEGFAESRISSSMRKADIGGRHTVIDSSRWLDRILIPLAASPENRSYVIETPLIADKAEIEVAHSADIVSDPAQVEAIYNELLPSLNFKYPDDEASMIPAKVSVSKLYPELLNEERDYSDLIIKAENLESRKPRFMGGGNDAAEKGTATHLFLQFCDYSRLEPTEGSVKEEIGRLLAEKYITNDVAELIRVNEIVGFVKSNLFTEISNSKKLYREMRFNIFLPASEFTTQESLIGSFSDEKILVQGVIDLCFVSSDDQVILCDYKTDRLSREMLKNKELAKRYLAKKHIQQLSYYCKAIESILGRKPDKVYIYSLAFGDTFDIDL